jgi:hypothetical protein
MHKRGSPTYDMDVIRLSEHGLHFYGTEIFHRPSALQRQKIMLGSLDKKKKEEDAIFY